MARKVFYSFHFDNDFFRTQQVRNMNSFEGQSFCSANAWEEVKQDGDAAVEKWIDDNLKGKSCLVVLVGSQTANRKWVKKEIVKAWNAGKGVLGVRINKLKDTDGLSGTPGANPFSQFSLQNGKNMGSIAPLKTPAGTTSKEAYASIRDNLEAWIEEAIEARSNA